MQPTDGEFCSDGQALFPHLMQAARISISFQS
jgi:hypothetical protein